jgi:hypothetical protein
MMLGPLSFIRRFWDVGVNAGSRRHCRQDGCAADNDGEEQDFDDDQNGGDDPETSWDLPGSQQGKDGDLCWFGFWLVVALFGSVIVCC